MNKDANQLLYLLLDKGSFMSSTNIRNIERNCMNSFISMTKNSHYNSLVGLITFDSYSKIICDLTSNYDELLRKYSNTLYSNIEISNCYEGIEFSANQLIQKSKMYPDANLRIIVVTCGTINQSDALTISRIANLLTTNKIFLDVVLIDGWISPALCYLSNLTGACFFRIKNNIDQKNIFNDPAFYDPRIRKFNQREIFKITGTMIFENDRKNYMNVERYIPSVYCNQNKRVDIRIDNKHQFNQASEDIHELKNEIISKNDEIQNKITATPDANYVILIGITGNGKSTFMNSIFGTIMEADILYGQKILKIKGTNSNDSNQIGHFAKSQTRTVNIMNIPDLNIVLADCPGFFDTGGPDTAIINSVLVDKVFNGRQQMKMKFLVFISKDDLDTARFEKVKKSFDMVLRLIPDKNILKEYCGVVITKGQIGSEEDEFSLFESIIHSKSKKIGEICELIKAICDKKHVWSFPTPPDSFKFGTYNDFPDADKIRNFMKVNPVINPPHSIPFDYKSLDRVMSLKSAIGNCNFLVTELFGQLSLEFLFNKSNLSSLKCWKCQISKIGRNKFKSLSDFARQIESIIPYPDYYSKIFKSMHLLTIFQSLAFNVTNEDVNNKDSERKRISSSLNSLHKDFFCENDIKEGISKSLITLNNYIQEAEKEEIYWKNEREKFDRKEKEFVDYEISIWEKIEDSQKNTDSIDSTIKEETRKMEEKRKLLLNMKNEIKEKHQQRRESIILYINDQHNKWMNDAHDRLNSLLKNLNYESQRYWNLRNKLH